MEKRIVQTVIILILATFSLNAQQAYYYYQGRKINLTTDNTCLNIIADNELLKSLDASSISQNFEIERNFDLKNQQMLRLKFKTVVNEQEYLNTVNTLKENLRLKYVFPYFKRRDAEPIGTSDIFYVKLKDAQNFIALENLVRQQNMKIRQPVAYTPLWYVVSLQGSDFNNAIDASNYFFETGLFENIDPAFMFDFKPNCTNDPMFDQLWGLSNSYNPGIDVNACNAWTITRGDGIKVAVVDQGIYMTHNDLSANISPLSFDAQSGTSPSVFTGEYHGTHVAGTVAAVRNNNLQVVGVAPESSLIGVSHDLYISPTISSELAGGINWAWQNGADIITNSWGDQGGIFYDDLHSAVLEDAIMSAIRQGRNGKGSVVTFAAGNHAPVMDYPAYFNDSILTVGAIESYGYRAYFSGYGNSLDVVAPGVDILSTFPYNNTGYYDGTSMATPHVAGVAALVLSVNPDLTGQQVRDIIESTAQKVGDYNYQPDSDHPNGDWFEEMGYGLIDAYAAVQAAMSCFPVYFINRTVTTNTTVTACDDIIVQNVSVTNGAKLTLDAAGKVNIISGFNVVLGSKLEIIQH
jgi:subtilisin family serine protease